MQPWDWLFYWICSSHSHSHFTSAWFASSLSPTISLNPFHTASLAVLHSHQALKASTHYFGWFASSPLPLPSHLPIPHCQVWQCFAHIKHLRHQHITLAWFASSPLHCHLFFRSPPNRLLHIHGSLVGMGIWVFIRM